MKNIKTYLLMLLCSLFSLQSCETPETEKGLYKQAKDTIPPLIIMRGRKVDTAFLQISSTTLVANATSGYTWLPGNSSNYYDAGAVVRDHEDQQLVGCTDISVECTGSVNNKSLGTYFLHYDAEDAAGNAAATVTRTVHVVENGAAFLNGNYNVTCTCIATTDASKSPTITTNSYMANVTTSGIVNNRFDVSLLKIGPDYITASAILKGNFIEALFDDPDPAIYHRNSSTCGILSATKNEFIIETEVNSWKPSIKYKCRNVYTKIEKDDTIN